MKDLYNCCHNVDAKSIALYSGIKIVHVVVSDRKPGVVVQVVPPPMHPTVVDSFEYRRTYVYRVIDA